MVHNAKSPGLGLESEGWGAGAAFDMEILLEIIIY
jgi:hypothetical protein